ncbi:RuvB-like protein 2 [Nematocida minor]|uniref:RuvB-like protein 2 n=1 Tax=Nematocida minor TaxID=1912983 RepID=UPI0022211F31|nr:RuvB-like protein 2 [Nematocida minor]KAI5190211.1 RuvB-like protein 2 [Nematocida minor]
MFEKVNSIALLERVGMHSHIQSLGIDRIEDTQQQKNGGKDSISSLSCSGLVGRHQERKTLFLLSKLVEQHKSRTILITGPSGSGKSALEYALTQDLKRKGIPSKTISASEIFSSSLSKTESLTQAIRESLGIRVQETSKVLEGEVVEIITDRERATSGRVIMKTTEVEAAYTFGAGIMQEMHSERVEVGDIISVNKSTGTVKRKGRSLSQSRDFEAIGGAGQYLPCPDGEILRNQVNVHTVTFHEIDILNSTQNTLRTTKGEIAVEIREAVNNTMKEWIEEGRGELITGVLFINESELLDAECYSYLNTLSEVSTSPVIMLSSSKEECAVRGSNEMCKYGMPADFYSRVLEIRLGEYTEEEIKEIVRIRVKEESDKITEEGIEEVSKLAIEHGLRYAFNMLSVLDVYSERVGKEIGKKEVEEVSIIFPVEESLAS